MYPVEKKVEKKVEKNLLTFRISQRIITVMCINHLRFPNVACVSDTRDSKHAVILTIIGGRRNKDQGASICVIKEAVSGTSFQMASFAALSVLVFILFSVIRREEAMMEVF
jgi:hypothetical protein